MNYNCSIFWDLRNLQEQVKKAFCYQKLFWPFTVWINCSSDLKNFENSRLSASNFKSFSRSLEQFFLTVGQNNFGNKIPLLHTWILNDSARFFFLLLVSLSFHYFSQIHEKLSISFMHVKQTFFYIHEYFIAFFTGVSNQSLNSSVTHLHQSKLNFLVQRVIKMKIRSTFNH